MDGPEVGERCAHDRRDHSRVGKVKRAALRHRARLQEAEAERWREAALSQRAEDARKRLADSEAARAGLEAEVKKLRRKAAKLQRLALQREHASQMEGRRVQEMRNRVVAEGKRSKELEEALRDRGLQLATLRQRSAVLRERVRCLESSEAPAVLKEQHERELQQLELSFAKKQQRWQFEAQQAVMAKEAALHEQYKQIAETAISNAQSCLDLQLKREAERSSALEQQVVQLRATTVSIDAHKRMLEEAGAIGTTVRNTADMAGKQAEAHRGRLQLAEDELARCKAKHSAEMREMEQQLAEKKSGHILLTERLQDQTDLLAQERAKTRELEAQNARLCERLSRAESRAVSATHHAKNATSTRESEALKCKQVQEAAAVEIAKLKASLASSAELHVDARDHAEARAAAAETRAREAELALEAIRAKHEELLNTMQVLLPKMRQTELRRRAAEQEMEDADEAAEAERSREEEMLARLESEAAAHKRCQAALRQERARVAEAHKANERLEQALESARNAFCDQLANLKRETKRRSAEQHAGFVAQEQRLRQHVERLEARIRGLAPEPAAVVPRKDCRAAQQAALVEDRVEIEIKSSE